MVKKLLKENKEKLTLINKIMLIEIELYGNTCALGILRNNDIGLLKSRLYYLEGELDEKNNYLKDEF